MKFSYSLIKSLVPGVKSKAQVIDALNLQAFETESEPGDTLNISVPTNRYSDAASHWGVAKEVAAILKTEFKGPTLSRWENQAALAREVSSDKQSSSPVKQAGKIKKLIFGGSKKSLNFKVLVQEDQLCPRYTAQFFNNIKVGPSPRNVQKVLKSCGLRPINNIVDIMNYVMLETGQPLHAFDFNKIANKEVVIRCAKKGDAMTSIDGIEYKLDSSMLVIADSQKVLGLAGIKGAQGSEVTEETKQILVESANFDPPLIYKTSKALNLTTDASTRFSHQLHPHLALLGISRAAELLNELADAREGGCFDSLQESPQERALKFDIEEFNHFVGMKLDLKTAGEFFERLGFGCRPVGRRGNNEYLEVKPPLLRQDIQNHEDLFEEVVRLSGLDKVPATPPKVAIKPLKTNESLLIKSKIRNLLSGFGLNEVYNTSFAAIGEVEVENPISEEKKYLRDQLKPLLLKNIEENLRFFDSARIFEVGKTFRGRTSVPTEKWHLGMAIASTGDNLFEAKGIIEQLLESLGLTDFATVPEENRLKIEAGHTTLGHLELVGETAVAEIDIDELLPLIKGEISFEPLPKYPAVVRDLSISVPLSTRIGEVIEAIQKSNLDLIEDVDLVDEYTSKQLGDRQGITLRMVFQSRERTLTSEEVDEEVKNISTLLEDKFSAEIR